LKKISSKKWLALETTEKELNEAKIGLKDAQERVSTTDSLLLGEKDTSKVKLPVWKKDKQVTLIHINEP